MDVAAELRQLNEELTNALEAEKEKGIKYRDQLLETRHELVQKDYTVQNQKQVIENLNKTLKLYENENKHMRGLLRLWV